MIYLSALILGLAGSMHCAGMCGPIAIAIPLPKKSISGKLLAALINNAGRIVTYAILGALLGLLGKGLVFVGFQSTISVATGIAMIVYVIITTFITKTLQFESGIFTFVKKLKIWFGRFLQIKNYHSLFILGLINGLRPCGLVYVALAGSIATSSFASGALFMTIFGLGTAPMLIAITLAGNAISYSLRVRMQKMIPFVVVFVGLLFILRGLNLGIPYLSPEQSKLKIPELKKEQPLHKTKPPCCK